jgi:hypothetical protein
MRKILAMTQSSVIFLILVLIGGTSSIAVAQNEPLTVCQMLDSIGEHEEVVVRGVMIGEPHHGYYLSQEGISNGNPCPGWRQRFFTAPSFAGIAIVSSFGVKLSEEQERLNRAFVRRLSGVKGEPALRAYKVTVKGVLARKPSPLTFRRADGTYSCIGKGSEGECFALFVVQSIIVEGN